MTSACCPDPLPEASRLLARLTFAVAEAQFVAEASPTDREVIRALAARGIAVRATDAVWAHPATWEQDPGTVILKACWDSHLRLEEFLAWLRGLEARGVSVMNAVGVVEWNARKRYLLDLAARDIRCVPTVFLRRDAPVDHVEVLAILAASNRHRWTQVVIKPEVSASGDGTWRATLPLAEADALDLRTRLAHADLLVQPFRRGIIERGETSLVFLGGRHSHAVLKRAPEGEFRVQQEFGGSRELVTVSPEVIAFGEQALAAAAACTGSRAEEFLYARVDLLDVPGSEPELMELELIDPELFLDLAPGAPERFADAIAAAIAAAIGVRA